MPTNFGLVKAMSESPWAGEFFKELEKQKFQSLGAEQTPEQVENAASIVAMRHAPELVQALAVSEGRAADLGQLPASYVAQLATRGDLTQDTITEAATRMYPNLDRAAAVRKWQQAAKAVTYDVREGDANPATPYDPAAGTRPRESNG